MVATTPSGGSTTTDDLAATPAGLLTGDQHGAALAYNAAQQLTDLVPDAGAATSFAYNARGARTSSTVEATALTPELVTAYEYAPSGALASVTTPTTTVEYASDGRGLRQSRTAGAITQEFTWSTARGLPLLLDDGEHTYLYGPSLTPLAQVDNSTGAIQYLHSDLLGTPRLITDASGAEAGTTTYDAFGNAESQTGTARTAIGFTGNWTDPDTGLVYLRARDYDPATGQFLAVDPAVDSTRQPYAYVGNNPVMLTDPTGLADWWDVANWDSDNWQDAGAFAAGVAGGILAGAAVVAGAAALGACAAATFGLCAVGVAAVAAVASGAIGGAIQYGLQSGDKSWCGFFEALGWGAVGGLIGGALGAALGKVLTPVIKALVPSIKQALGRIGSRLGIGGGRAALPTSGAVSNVIAGLAAGRNPGVWTVPNEAALNQTFSALVEDATPTIWAGYSGRVFTRSDGVQVGLRPQSASGGATIDIHFPDQSKPWKVHIG